jgi:Transglutaminase-like superfamily
MSAGSLFDSENDSGSGAKAWLIGASALVLIVGLASGVVWYSKPAGRAASDILAQKIRDNTILMLQYPTFSGEEFRQQVLGKGRLIKYIKVNDEAFFAYPPGDEQEFEGFVAKYFFDAKLIDYGKDEDGTLRVGDYKIPAGPYAAHFFRTSLSNIHLPSDQTLTFPYASGNYTLTLQEMENFVNGTQVYGGAVITREPERTNKQSFIFANHGSMVAKPGEPSLLRLTENLLKEAGPSREERIQRLVDFVSTDIEYSYSEAVSSGETLKRASETLMTRSGDCSNKTILLASMLEQIGEPYLMLYCPRHITVAVPRGSFPDENKLDFEWDAKQWVIAETTLPGFQVGTTRLADSQRLQTVQYVQEPKHVDVIFDAGTSEVLKYF